MPPKIENNRFNHRFHFQPQETKKGESNLSNHQVNPNSVQARQTEFNFYGTQQRDRLERLYGAAAAGLSSFNDIRLTNATREANWAYARTYQQELKALSNPTSSANPPTNLVEVANRAEAAYRSELAKSGFTPFDVRGTSALKVVDFLNLEANRRGNFTTPSPAIIQNRLLSGETPTYFVRVVESKYLNSATATFSKPSQPNVWVATPEEIAGAKLDGFEVMKRVGFDDNYISQLHASGKKPSDFTLVIIEARGTNGSRVPNWDSILKLTKDKINSGSNPDLLRFQGKPNDFWENVKTLDYRSHLENMERQGMKLIDYANRLPGGEGEIFLARNQIEQNFGVNKFFTADGRTARTDGKNGSYGVREFLIDNNSVTAQQRQAYIQLRETNASEVAATNRVPGISENPLRLGTETRNGALIGGTLSAVTSLPQVFEQYQNGEYAAATRTLVTNSALGTSVGGFSSAGERIVGRGIENSLSRSTFVQNNLERLYTNGAARSVVSRFAATESSTISSQAFSSTVRTMAGRIGGAGVIGGVVNGAFSAYDQISAYQRGEVTASQAIGTVTGETAVGVGAGLAGAAAGAAIGSIIPGAGTIVGGIIGFGVGLAAGYLADKGLRGLGVDKAIASGVTTMIDEGGKLVENVQNFGHAAVTEISNTFDSVKNDVSSTLNDVGNALSGGLKSVFGW